MMLLRTLLCLLAFSKVRHSQAFSRRSLLTTTTTASWVDSSSSMTTTAVTASNEDNHRIRRIRWSSHRATATTTTRLRATETLVFEGDYGATTDALPADTTETDAARFLDALGNRDIFLSAGGTRHVEEVHMTERFKGYWRDVCRAFRSSVEPADDDALVAVTTEVRFPGLRLVTSSVSGIKEIRDPETDLLKAFEVFLIAEKSEPQGAPPVVWIYNRLTGNDEKESGVFQPPKQARAKSVIGYTRLDDDSLVLSFQLDMQVVIEFPAVLLKILPTSKEKAEAQGSASVLKAVSRDIDSALQAAYDRFMEQRRQ